MKLVRLLPIFVAAAVLAVGVILSVFRTGDSPTMEEQKQMDILAGQLFRCYERSSRRMKTFEIKPFRTTAEFDAQHRAIPWIRFVASRFERYGWQKNRPVDVSFCEERVLVSWLLPEEALQDPDRCGLGWEHQAIINTNDMSVVFLPEWPDEQ